jgi:hypothetical protein
MSESRMLEICMSRFDERGVETGATGDLVRHRQTKEAATDMVDLKPPASHSDSTVADGVRPVSRQRTADVHGDVLAALDSAGIDLMIQAMEAAVWSRVCHLHA